MAKSAQEKFNEYLDECRETSDAAREFVDRAYDNYKSYGYACGALQSMICDLIGELPKARRAELRNQLYSMAQKQKNELLAKMIKETA
jgi:hypothetical protein